MIKYYFTDGDSLREILPSLSVGTLLYYLGTLHKVISTKDGNRISYKVNN